MTSNRCPWLQRRHILVFASVIVLLPAFSLQVQAAGDDTTEIQEVRSRRMIGHEFRVATVAISDDGLMAITGGDDKSVRVWNFKTGQQIHKLSGHRDRVRAIAISHDGRHVFSGGIDRIIRQWDLTTGLLVKEFRMHKSSIRSIVVLPDNQHILSTSAADKAVLLWDLANPRHRRSFPGHIDEVWDADVNLEANVIVSGSADTTVRVFNMETGEESRRFEQHSGTVRDIEISKDGKHVFSCGANGEILSLEYSNRSMSTTIHWAHEQG